MFPPQPRQFNGFTLDEETIEFVPLGWFELRVRTPIVPPQSTSALHAGGADDTAAGSVPGPFVSGLSSRLLGDHSILSACIQGH